MTIFSSQFSIYRMDILFCPSMFRLCLVIKKALPQDNNIQFERECYNVTGVSGMVMTKDDPVSLPPASVNDGFVSKAMG